MFAQILRWSLVITLWKRYQKQCLALLLLILAWLLVGILHQDFIEYRQMTQTQDDGIVAWSFVAKWLLNLGFLLMFVIYVKVSSKTGKSHSPLHKDMAQAQTQTQSQNKSAKLNDEVAEQDDPFARIRQKPSLRSKGDIIIEESSKNKD